MLRYWKHTALNQVYVSPERLYWQYAHWKTPSSQAHSCFVARQAPDQGHPERECGVVPIQHAMFEQFCQEISQHQASELDPHLVTYLTELARHDAQRCLAALRPEIQALSLRMRTNDAEGITFEVHADPAPWLLLAHRLLPLTDLLLDCQVLPTHLVDGRPLLLVPHALCAGQVEQAARVLALALAVRLWGEQAEPCLAWTLDA